MSFGDLGLQENQASADDDCNTSERRGCTRSRTAIGCPAPPATKDDLVLFVDPLGRGANPYDYVPRDEVLVLASSSELELRLSFDIGTYEPGGPDFVPWDLTLEGQSEMSSSDDSIVSVERIDNHRYLLRQHMPGEVKLTMSWDGVTGTRAIEVVEPDAWAISEVPERRFVQPYSESFQAFDRCDISDPQVEPPVVLPGTSLKFQVQPERDGVALLGASVTPVEVTSLESDSPVSMTLDVPDVSRGLFSELNYVLEVPEGLDGRILTVKPGEATAENLLQYRVFDEVESLGLGVEVGSAIQRDVICSFAPDAEAPDTGDAVECVVDVDTIPEPVLRSVCDERGSLVKSQYPSSHSATVDTAYRPRRMVAEHEQPLAYSTVAAPLPQEFTFEPASALGMSSNAPRRRRATSR